MEGATPPAARRGAGCALASVHPDRGNRPPRLWSRGRGLGARDLPQSPTNHKRRLPQLVALPGREPRGGPDDYEPPQARAGRALAAVAAELRRGPPRRIGEP